MRLRTKRSSYLFTAALVSGVALGGACSSKSGPAATAPAPSGSASSPPPFEASPPEVYVAKVKNLLVGYAPTDAEIAAVKADATALGSLIDGWMAMPEYEHKMLGFFATAFQQSQVVSADFATQMPGVQGQIGNNGAVASRLLSAMRVSYALTVWQLIQEGKPFSETMTTRRFMMNPPLMALYAFLDEHHVDDASKVVDRIVAADPSFSISVTAQAPIPLEQSLDPKSPNYMHWYLPDLGKDAACGGDPRVYKKSPAALYQVLMGGLETSTLADGTKCQGGATGATNGQFQASDFDAWKMVTIRAPQPNEAVTAFYDIPTLRTANELVLAIPRIGFFTTPSFLAQWNTNLSNSARVTINQTMVVALGRIFDGSHPTMPQSQAATDAPHATPPECATCHTTLDPMRQYFRQAFTVNFHEQTDATETQLPGMFAFDGVTTAGAGGFSELGDQLAQHPGFAVAWAQKLCYYANSAPCAADDPELARIVASFQASQSWNALVKDVFSSPVTTGASETKTADANLASGAAVTPISRRGHLCNALSNRLGLTDACALTFSGGVNTPQGMIQSITTDLPSDGYGRGSPVPVLANDPDMFFRGSVENLCRLLAAEVVDGPASSRYKSSDPTTAIADFVSNVMALTSGDARAAGANAILTDHFAAAQSQGASASDALKSTFVLACTSPSSVGLGLLSEIAMILSRRQAVLSTLFGAGLVGLRALATGLPAALLIDPRKALADGMPMACSPDTAQYLIFATSSLGDPIDCNVPGTYGDPGILHPADPTMAETPLTLRGTPFTAAAPWATLPQSVLDRTCFFHNATTTPVHPKQPEVMALNGAVRTYDARGAAVPDMLVSVLAAMLAPCLGTIQREPITLGAASPTEAVTFQGRVQPSLSPVGLRAILTDGPGPLTNLEKLRDADLDRMNALFRKDGTAAQRSFLDRYASSQGQIRALSQDLVAALASLKDNSPTSQVTAAIAMIRMNVSPVVTVHIPFGGDNHFDKALTNESLQTVAGVSTIALLMQALADAGLSDKVTFASANVFGRTKSVAHKTGTDGRDHNQNHHCAILIGKGVAGGVVGGVTPMSGDYGAMNIDSSTGAGSASGDIGINDMMSAYGKTLGAAVGVDGPTLDGMINGGKIVKGALA